MEDEKGKNVLKLQEIQDIYTYTLNPFVIRIFI